jgi:hypothetical protein
MMTRPQVSRIARRAKASGGSSHLLVISEQVEARFWVRVGSELGRVKEGLPEASLPQGTIACGRIGTNLGW